MSYFAFMIFLDVHTHQPVNTDRSILNLHRDFERVLEPGNYSTGIHPRYVQENWEQELGIMSRYATSPSVHAIGECGLDRLCAAPFSLQETVFRAQIKLANQLGKPLVIHCVRAFEEVLQLLREEQNKVPVIFHGFNKNAALAGQLLKCGHYLSFGKALQMPALQSVFSLLPLSHVFLETDDSGMSIADIYRLAAGIRQIPEESLSLQLQKNATEVFRATSFGS